MNEACSSDLNGRSACDHELDDILVISYAAASNDRDIEHLAALSYHTDGNGLNCRTGISACVIGKHRSSGPDIDTHAHKCVDEHYCISAAILGSQCGSLDIRYIRCELAERVVSSFLLP